MNVLDSKNCQLVLSLSFDPVIMFWWFGCCKKVQVAMTIFVDNYFDGYESIWNPMLSYTVNTINKQNGSTKI